MSWANVVDEQPGNGADVAGTSRIAVRALFGLGVGSPSRRLGKAFEEELPVPCRAGSGDVGSGDHGMARETDTPTEVRQVVSRCGTLVVEIGVLDNQELCRRLSMPGAEKAAAACA